MMIPNQWYAVLESNEVKTGQPVAFKRLNEELVFWRDEAGQVVVMQDRCPHRQAKLSPGKIVDGNIQCPFHGFQFNSGGGCELIPANGKNGPRPRIFKTKVYPAQEAHGFVWVWNGEAREEYPPVPFFEDLAGYSYGTLRQQWATHYTRAIENQLDVAHLPFVHASTIGRDGKTLVNGPYTLLENDTLQVWLDNQHDQGQTPARPREIVRPQRPAMLVFKFPNIWVLNISEKVRIMVAFAPVDGENTMMYVRLYHNLAKSKLARSLISKIGAQLNRRILNQDKAIVVTQNPKQGGLDVGDNYIPADRPLLVYHMRRNELIQATHEATGGDLVAYAERKAAG